MNKLTKYLSVNAFLLLFLITGLNAQAQVDQNIWDNPKQDDIFWNGQQQEFSNSTGLGDLSPVTMITNIINIGMGFIGIMTVIMFMLAGFKMMLSGGNEDKMLNSKKMMWSTVVGTFLMLASFGIAKFFIGTVANATGLY